MTEPVLSDGHRVLWLAEQLRPGTVLDPTCEVHLAFRFQDRPDLDVLGRALDAVVERHDALRSIPVVDDGQLVVVERSAPSIGVDRHDLPAGAGDDDLRRLVQEIATAPYDLDGGRLLRSAWVDTGDGGGVVVLGMYHWAGDAGALDALVHEVHDLYHSIAHGAPAPPAPARYADVARPSELDEGSVTWWDEQLSGARKGWLPVAPGRTETGGMGLVSRFLAEDTDEALRRLTATNRASPFMVLLAALTPVFEHDGAQQDATVFAVDSARRGPAERVIGFMATPLALRLQCDLRAPFTDVLAKVRSAVVGALTHRNVPFVRLLEAAPGVAGLVDLETPTTVVQYFPLEPLVLGDLCGEPMPTFEAAAGAGRFSTALPLSMAINVERIGDRHHVGVLHDDGLWDGADVEQALDRVEAVIRGAAVDPSRSALDLLEQPT